jgi:anti-anti-sigma factor
MQPWLSDGATMFEVHAEDEASSRARIVRVSGEIDIAVAAEFADALDRACSGAPAAVELDLSGLEFMDATGLNAILVSRNRADAAATGPFVVLGASPIIRRMFEATGLGSMLDGEPSQELS